MHTKAFSSTSFVLSSSPRESKSLGNMGAVRARTNPLPKATRLGLLQPGVVIQCGNISAHHAVVNDI
jgi:hypothetical protein